MYKSIKRKNLILAFAVVLLLTVSGGVYYFFLQPDPPLEEKFVTDEQVIRNVESPFEGFVASGDGKDVSQSGNNPEQEIEDGTSNQAENIKALPTPPEAYEVTQQKHTYQTFNNCGPATLTMFLSYFGVSAQQEALGNAMRPYQHPKGDNDDKTIFTSEFTDWAIEYGEDLGLQAVGRPNGSIELLKHFTSNDIPVVVKTWLNPKEDIGHFLLVRGYDDNKEQVLVDDSYYGPNRTYSYYQFLSLWQPFNYNYVVAYTSAQQETAEQILGSELKEQVAWQNTVTRAHKENEIATDNIYPIFNLSVGYYHLGEFEKSVEYYERVEDRLPRRMLWYQIEPIKAYVELGQYDRVLAITQEILEDGNRAFSELYFIRGNIFLEKGDEQKAREEYEKAVQYNQNYQPAKEALEKL